MSVKSTPQEMFRLHLKRLGHSEEKINRLLTHFKYVRSMMEMVDNFVFLHPESPAWPESTLGVGMAFREDVEQLVAQGRMREGMGGLTIEKDSSESPRMLSALLLCCRELEYQWDERIERELAQRAARTPDRPHNGLLMTVEVSDALLHHAQGMRRAFWDAPRKHN